jgi:hypothetical protein
MAAADSVEMRRAMRRTFFTLWIAVAAAAMAQEPAPAPEIVDVTLWKEVVEGKTPFSCPHCDLQGQDFSGLKLLNANFVGANLAGAKFNNAILDGSDFAGANLTGAHFDGVQCNGCDLSVTELDAVTANGGVFKGADVQFAHMGASLLHAGVFAAADAGPDLTAAAPNEPWVCGTYKPDGGIHMYVAASGTDSGGCGDSMTTPCATVQQGIVRCASKPACDVLVGWGEYKLSGPVRLAMTINVYGGCVAASRARPDYVSLLVAPPGQPAVKSESLGPKTIQGFELLGYDHPGSNGEASVAMQVVGSATVVNCRIVAGSGAKGKRGDDGGNGNNGGGGDGANGGKNDRCNQGFGGNGGRGKGVSVTVSGLKITCTPNCSPNGCDGLSGGYGNAGGGGGGGVGSSNCAECPITSGGGGGGGVTGNNAACADGGTASPSLIGSFSNSVFVPAVANGGNTGQVGGGGGGGGGGGFFGGWCFFVYTQRAGGAGGGGGAGGCGGSGGGGGQMGGASIGIVVIGGPLSIKNSRVVGGRGGQGGDGGTGGKGGSPGGGAGGAGGEKGAGTGGPGGRGGAGGAGGGGAGGNGGPSIGIALVSGANVDESDVAYLNGVSGIPGTHGNGGLPVIDGACKAKDGADGVKGTVAWKQKY